MAGNNINLPTSGLTKKSPLNSVSPPSLTVFKYHKKVIILYLF